MLDTIKLHVTVNEEQGRFIKNSNITNSLKGLNEKASSIGWYNLNFMIFSYGFGNDDDDNLNGEKFIDSILDDVFKIVKSITDEYGLTIVITVNGTQHFIPPHCDLKKTRKDILKSFKWYKELEKINL